MKVNFFMILAVGGLSLYNLGFADQGAATQKNLYSNKTVVLKEEVKLTSDSFPVNNYLQKPAGMAFNGRGEIFITDLRAQNIKIISTAGKFIRSIGQAGGGPGDFGLPTTISFNGKYLIVWEIGNSRFSLLDAKGVFVRCVKPADFLNLVQIRALPNGQTLVETENTNYGKNIGQECILTLYNQECEQQQEIYKRQILTNKFLRRSNTNMNLPQPFQPQISWAVLSTNQLVIAFQAKYQIGILDPSTGEQISFKHKTRPVAVTEQDKKEFFAGISLTGSSSQKKDTLDIIVKNTQFPKQKPLFERIMVDTQDHILVFLTAPANLSSTYPVDVFDSSGRFINRIEITGGKLGNIARFGPDGSLWTITKDQEDEPVIVKYTLY